MFGGGKWEKGEATIIAREFGKGKAVYTHFVADVKTGDGQVFRCELTRPSMSPSFWEPYPGDVVGVEADPKGQKARFDMSDPRLNSKDRLDDQKVNFQKLLAEAPGTEPSHGDGSSGSTSATSSGAPLDPELEALMKQEEEERRSSGG